MSRYIDADKLTFSRVRIIHPDGTAGGWNAVVMSSVINNAPTADAVEVRHGHWIKEFAWSYGYFDHHKLTCSECGLTFTEDARNVDEYKYCYGCGAKMDLEGRSENEG